MLHRAGVLIGPLETGTGSGAVPLYVQLYQRIRDAVLSGALPAGERLPSERTLAADLSVSRTTVEAAYRQLAAEGYLVRQVGSGSYVSHVFPERRTGVRVAATTSAPAPAAQAISARGEALARAGRELRMPLPALFASGVPAVDHFPAATWNRLTAKRMRGGGTALLQRSPPAGLRLLREAIAANVAAARGVRCEWEQVMVLSSTQQALDVAARLLLNEHDPVWVEDPGFPGAFAVFRGAGARLCAVPVDRDGMDVHAAVERCPGARMAYVSPSRHCPLGVTLSLERRQALIRWAAAGGAWIVEDDYDSELRLSGRPVIALQGLDEQGRVLYVGTFNKVLFPGLRLAFCVVPRELAEPFAAVLAVTGGGQSTLLQTVLADFVIEGHFAAHVRRIRELYRERRDALVDSFGRHLAGALRLGDVDSGPQAVLWLPEGADERDVFHRARAAGLELPPLARFRLESSGPPGLLLTYGGETPERIDAGMRRMADLLGVHAAPEMAAA